MTAPALSGLVAVPWLANRDPRLRVLAAAGFALVAVGLTLDRPSWPGRER